MNRRRFIQYSSVFVLGGMFLPRNIAWGKSNVKRIHVLHTNDFHSRMEAFPPSHPQWPNQGGIVQLGTKISEIKNTQDPLLLLDCGDVFQGTPYFNFFKGHPELQWMTQMGYDATTLGNHDFDLGIDHLATMRKQYPIPTVNCNYNLEQTPLASVVKNRLVVQKGGFKVGITGVSIDLNGLIADDLRKGLNYMDPIACVQNQVDYLKHTEHCDLVIVLSHLGYQYDSPQIDDLKLAKATHGIDLILGGHTHTFLPKPTEILNAKNIPVLINQAGWAGLELGHIQVQG